MVDIDELERLLAAATPGRWCLQTGALGVNPWISGPNWTRPDRSYVRGGCILNMVAHDEREHDAALIVAARNSLPAILTEIRELRAENARLKRDKETLLQFAQAIKTWRSDANSYDRECGHTKRHYCEDVELMEKAAEYAMRRVVARAALGEPQ